MTDFLDHKDLSPVRIPMSGTVKEAVHVFDESSLLALNAALAARRPLLVRGEPGTGKTQLAHAAAVRLGRVVLSKTIDARTEARDLFFEFDAVARLAEAQVQGALSETESDVREALDLRHFLTPGVLWRAFDPEGAAALRSEPSSGGEADHGGAVVLLDEIDKADSSVPNGLLEALGSGTFEAPGGRKISFDTDRAPLLVISTNEERALPDAFLRRCIVLHLALPTDHDELVRLLVSRGEAHHGSALSKEVLETCADMVAGDREVVRSRGLTPPGQAEYLDLLRAVARQRDAEKEQLALLEKIGQFALRKHPEV